MLRYLAAPCKLPLESYFYLRQLGCTRLRSFVLPSSAAFCDPFSFVFPPNHFSSSRPFFKSFGPFPDFLSITLPVNKLLLHSCNPPSFARCPRVLHFLGGPRCPVFLCCFPVSTASRSSILPSFLGSIEFEFACSGVAFLRWSLLCVIALRTLLRMGSSSLLTLLVPLSSCCSVSCGRPFALLWCCPVGH